MVRCMYCTQEYPNLTKTQDEFTRDVMKHVQATHPDNWKRCGPNDVWVVVVPDKQ